MRTGVAAVIASVALVPVLAMAQQPAPADSAAAARARAVTLLSPGAHVRVQLRGDGRVSGPLLRSGRDSLVLGQPEAPRAVALADVERLWERKHATLAGAIVVGTVAAVSTGGVMYLIGLLACSEGCPTGPGPGTWGLIGAVAGGITGAAIGGALGTLIPTWRRRFP
jgi:hypothetical protein